MPPRSVPSPDWVYIQRVKRKRELEKKAKAAGKDPNSLGNPHHHHHHHHPPGFSSFGNNVGGISPAGNSVPHWFNIEQAINSATFVEDTDPLPVAHFTATFIPSGNDDYFYPPEVLHPAPGTLGVSNVSENLNDSLASMAAQMNALSAGMGVANTPATHGNSGNDTHEDSSSDTHESSSSDTDENNTNETHENTTNSTAPQAAGHQGTQTGDLEDDSWRFRAASAARSLSRLASGRAADVMSLIFHIAIIAVIALICAKIV